jgi:hypothetical protein
MHEYSWAAVVFCGIVVVFFMRLIDWIDGASRKHEQAQLRELQAECEGWRKWASGKESSK